MLTHRVIATITDDNYTGDDATGTLVISEASSETSIVGISPADSQTVGEGYTVTVSVTGSGPTGMVDVSDGDSASCQITLPGDSCELTSTSVGTRTITAEYPGDDGHGPSADQVSYDITPAEPGPVALSFSTEPVGVVVDAPISPAVVVYVLDSSGELVEDDDETIVAIELETNPHGATLSGTLSVQVSSGIAVFDDLVIDTIGAGYRLRAADDQATLDASVTDTFEVLGGGIFEDRFQDGQTSGTYY
jgi:hypothetical protein